MAKRKKAKQIIANKNQTLSYQGTINLNIVHGGRTIISKKYTNSGMPELFRFLANCLAGNFSNALRPMKIRLYKYKDGADAQEHPTDPSYAEYQPNMFTWATRLNRLESVSPFIAYDGTPVLTAGNETGEQGSYSVTFHFNVPFAYLHEKLIHVVGFFPDSVISDANPSAYYLFTKEDETTHNIVWDGLELTDSTGDYNLIINWTLSIQNQIKQVTTNNQ